MKLLRMIVTNPYLNLVVGLLLLYSSGAEAWHELQALERFHVGTHHGVIIFALLHILKTLPDLFEGLEHIDQYGDEDVLGTYRDDNQDGS